MARITVEGKEAIIKKALERGDKSLREIAEANNVGYSSLLKWLRLSLEGKPLSSRVTINNATKSEIHPLKHLLATAGLDEQAIGAYCREQGIYSYQLQQWQDEIMANNGNPKPTKERSELKALRDEIQCLKKDLDRKNKALAETTALLVLKKKADLIWGVPEEG